MQLDISGDQSLKFLRRARGDFHSGLCPRGLQLWVKCGKHGAVELVNDQARRFRWCEEPDPGGLPA